MPVDAVTRLTSVSSGGITVPSEHGLVADFTGTATTAGPTMATTTGSIVDISGSQITVAIRLRPHTTNSRRVCGAHGTATTGWLMALEWPSLNMYCNASQKTGTNLSVSTWAQVAMSFDGASQKHVAKDGVVTTSSQTASFSPSGLPVLIGGYYWSGYAEFDGEIDYLYVWDRGLSPAELQVLHANPYAILAPRRIMVPVSAGGGGATADLSSTGQSGALSASASSPATAALSQTGASGALSASAHPLVTAALAQTGGSGIFVGSAFSPAVAALAATGQSGAFSGTASSPATATLGATGGSGSLTASASTSTTVDLAATGNSGTLSATASAPASASASLAGASGTLLASAATEARAVLAAQGGEGAFAGSAYPLTQADLAALGASGAFSASASTVATALAAITGTSGDLSAAAWTPATATAALVGEAGTLLAAVTGASGTAAAADIWNYVLSNGKTAGETAVETHAMLTALTVILGADVAPGINTLQGLRIILAAVSGPTTGIGTDTERYYSPDGATARITATFDAQGNRQSVTLDAS